MAKPKPVLPARPERCPRCGAKHLVASLDGWNCLACGWCDWSRATEQPLPKLPNGRHSRGEPFEG